MKNKYEDLEIADFCCEDNLIYEILHKTDTLDDSNVIEVYAKSELISYIFTTLLSMDFQIGVVDFDALSCDYCGEYTLTITEDKEIWIEPSYRKASNGDWKPFNSYAKYTYLYMGDVDQTLINHLLDSECDVILFGFEVEEENNNIETETAAIETAAEMEIEIETDEDMHGFTLSNSYDDSYYSCSN